MKAIESIALTKKFGEKTAVDQLNLSIDQGELFALLGANGAGKTTAIRMLSGLLKPTEGDAKIHGLSITQNTIEAKKIMNVSPQETAVAPNLSVKENLELICGIYGMDKAQARERSAACIQEFGFESVKNQRAKTLSGGWQRRLSIAMALITGPKVLFLDEPTLGLDVLARRELWETIGALKGRITIILTTHYLEEAQALSDRIGIMANGRLARVGTAQALMQAAGAATFEDAFVEICKEGGADA